LIRVPNAILSYCVLTTEFRGILDTRELHSANLYIIFFRIHSFCCALRYAAYNLEQRGSSTFSVLILHQLDLMSQRTIAMLLSNAHHRCWSGKCGTSYYQNRSFAQIVLSYSNSSGQFHCVFDLA